MQKNPKFNKRIRLTTASNTLPNDKDSSKASQSSINSCSSYTNTLSKIVKTEEDLLFKSERNIPNENEIYDIENKLTNNNYNYDILESNVFERENYVSNRDASIPKKIAPTTESVVNIQKELHNRKIMMEEELKKQKEEKEKKKKEDDVSKIRIQPNMSSTIFQQIIVLVIFVITVILILAITLFFLFKKKKKK